MEGCTTEQSERQKERNEVEAKLGKDEIARMNEKRTENFRGNLVAFLFGLKDGFH